MTVVPPSTGSPWTWIRHPSPTGRRRATWAPWSAVSQTRAPSRRTKEWPFPSWTRTHAAPGVRQVAWAANTTLSHRAILSRHNMLPIFSSRNVSFLVYFVWFVAQKKWAAHNLSRGESFLWHLSGVSFFCSSMESTNKIIQKGFP